MLVPCCPPSLSFWDFFIAAYGMKNTSQSNTMASTGVSASAGERTISSCLGVALYKHVMIAVS